MSGEKTEPVRPNVALPSQRFDQVDHLALAESGFAIVSANNRSLIATPKAVAGGLVGERWSGSITANPTSSADGLLRLDTDAFVGVDSNGQLVVKPAGVLLSTVIPSGGGNQQVYAYTADIPINTQVRRYLPATAPFIEFPQATTVEAKRTVGLYVRAGDFANAIPEDVVAGATRALLLLGVATNISGVVTFIPAPNTLETVTTPTLVPTTNTGTTTLKTTTTGSGNTLRDLLNAALYSVGQVAWKGSAYLTPSAANNYGAYRVPAGGVDKAYRNGLGYTTIGDGVNSFGDFDVSNFANSNLLLAAAIAATPTGGGVIVLKRGVQLTGFGGANVSMAASKHITIMGEHSAVPSTVPHIVFGASERFACVSTGSLTLQNLHIRWQTNAVVLANNSPCKITDCFFEKQDGTNTGAAVQSSSAVADIVIERCTFSIDINQTSQSASGLGIRLTNAARRLVFRDLKFVFLGLDASAIQLSDIRDDVLIDGVYVTVSGGLFEDGSSAVIASTTDNSVDISNRLIRRVHVTDPTMFGVTINGIGFLTIADSSAADNVAFSDDGCPAGYVRIINCQGGGVLLLGAWADLRIEGCYFQNGFGSSVGSVSANPVNVQFTGCRWQNYTGTPLLVTGAVIENALVRDCVFDNISQSTSADFACVKVVSAQINNCGFSRNLITRFQLVAYTGPANFHNLFQVNTSDLRILVCESNTARAIMNSTTGSNQRGAYLLRVTSLDDVATTAAFRQIDVRDNTIGTTNSLSNPDSVMLCRVNNFNTLDACVVTKNRVVCGHTTSAILSKLGPIVLVDTTNVSGSISRNVVISDNVIQMYDADGTSASPGMQTWIRLALGSTNSTSVDISRNTFWSGVAAAAFAAGNFGVQITATPVNFVFALNNAVAGSAVLPLHFTVTVPNPQVSMFTVPALNDPFSFNLNCRRV